MYSIKSEYKVHVNPGIDCLTFILFYVYYTVCLEKSEKISLQHSTLQNSLLTNTQMNPDLNSADYDGMCWSDTSTSSDHLQKRLLESVGVVKL